MTDTPLKAVTEELGAIVGRLERELRSDVRAQIAQLDTMAAEFELVVMRLEQDTKARVEAVVANVRDGRDGEPGLDGERGPPGEQGPAGPVADIPLAPPDVVGQIMRAFSLINAPIPAATFPAVAASEPARKKMIRKDRQGNIFIEEVA